MHSYHWQYQALLNSAETVARMGHCSGRIAHTYRCMWLLTCTDACWYSAGRPCCCCLCCFSLRVLQNRKPFCRLGRPFPFATRPVICSRCHHHSHCPCPSEDAAKGCAGWSGAICWVDPACNHIPAAWHTSLHFFCFFFEWTKGTECRCHFLSPHSCVHYSCEATDCQKLEIDNALLNCTGGGWYNGAQCNVSCRTGYILQVQRDDDLSKSQVCAAGFVWPTKDGWANGCGEVEK